MNSFTDGARGNLPGTIKLIGIGQSLRGDDGAGLAAVELWRERYHPAALPAGVQVELAELPGIGLLDLLQGAGYVILVDAVRSGAMPGTIHHLAEDQLGAFTGGSGSAHGWGVAETLSLGRQLTPDRLPAELVVIGIEAGQLDLGNALSPEIKASLPGVAHLIEEFIVAALSPRK